MEVTLLHVTLVLPLGPADWPEHVLLIMTADMQTLRGNTQALVLVSDWHASAIFPFYGARRATWPSPASKTGGTHVTSFIGGTAVIRQSVRHGRVENR